jgi:arthrofactin-type cyclic lipopeptide synthetase C
MAQSFARYSELAPTSRVPFHLMGHSIGGWVVFELAQAYWRQRSPASSVIIVDSEPPPKTDNNEELTNVDVIMKWIDCIELLVDSPLHISQRDIKSLRHADRQKLLLGRMLEHDLLPKNSRLTILDGPMKAFAAAIRASYTPSHPYLGSTHLILVDDPRLDPETNRKRHIACHEGWLRWAPNLTVTYLDGNHMTLLSPKYVDGLAAEIMRIINISHQS